MRQFDGVLRPPYIALKNDRDVHNWIRALLSADLQRVSIDVLVVAASSIAENNSRSTSSSRQTKLSPHSPDMLPF